MPKTKPDIDAVSFFKLQTLVLALGETRHFGWWKSDFLSPTGLNYLQLSYPRNTFRTAVQSALLAARTVHDTASGVGNVFHLFRPPQRIELAIRALRPEQYLGLESEILPNLSAQKELWHALDALADGVVVRVNPGPVQLNRAFAETSQLVAQLAAHYAAAFEKNIKVFPYWSPEGKA